MHSVTLKHCTKVLVALLFGICRGHAHDSWTGDMTSFRSGHGWRGSDKATNHSQIWLKFLENETAFEESTDPVWSGKLTAPYTAINIPVTNCHASQYAWVWVQQGCDRKGWLCQCWDIAPFVLWELSAISPWLHDAGKNNINLLSAIHTVLTWFCLLLAMCL